jgi:hypothetical protein
VGTAVLDMFKDAGLRPVSISIHGGAEVTQHTYFEQPANS